MDDLKTRLGNVGGFDPLAELCGEAYLRICQMDREIERLNKSLLYEEARTGRMGTHAPGCWKWGPSHYECALRHIKTLEGNQNV